MHTLLSMVLKYVCCMHRRHNWSTDSTIASTPVKFNNYLNQTMLRIAAPLPPCGDSSNLAPPPRAHYSHPSLVPVVRDTVCSLQSARLGEIRSHLKWMISVAPVLSATRHFHFHTKPRGVCCGLSPHSLTTPLPLLTEHQNIPTRF
uniref:Uncharacterized protein n=1 Tax=Branchiostoma floridae TaxID=7739 RepID=C3Y3Z4_BRAFL|eukprot:XP_002609010.1 hypothetical protein BRAFLDRAFT_84826 [Branchiostoma floridae]